MRRYPWWKCWSEARTDAKLIYLNDKQHRIWFNLMCLASESEDRGSIYFKSFFTLAIECGCNESEIMETVEILRKLEIIGATEQTITFLNFSKRNEPDDPTASKRNTEYRNRQKESQTVTPPLRTVTDELRHAYGQDIRYKNKKKEKDINTKAKDISVSKDTSLVTEGDERTKVPVKAIVDAYNKFATRLPACSKITDQRKRAIQLRWKSDEDRQSIEWWEGYFKAVNNSSFHVGENDRGWKADIDFCLRDKQCVKYSEGGFKADYEEPPDYSDPEVVKQRCAAQWGIKYEPNKEQDLFADIKNKSTIDADFKEVLENDNPF